mgnify:CR=1 FL=1
MKKGLHIFSFLLLMVIALSASAESFSAIHNGSTIYYNIIDPTTVEVTFRGATVNTYFDEYTGHVSIPSTVSFSGTTYSVVRIANQAFRDCHGLQSVSLPYGLQRIGNQSFYNCYGLQNVILPSTLIEIGFSAFANDTSLLAIDIPNSVTTIGATAFDNCRSMHTVSIGNGLSSLGFNAFSHCSQLQTLNYNAPNCSFGSSYSSYSPFGNDSALTTINIGESVVNIYSFFAYGCAGVRVINIGSHVTHIGEKAFMGCSRLEEITARPLTPPQVAEDAFIGVSSIVPFHAPCASTSLYFGWGSFGNIVGYDPYQVEVSVNDTTLGSASNYCSRLTAIPATRCHFVSWNDGNTDNPRTISLHCDTVFQAIFERNPEIFQIEVTSANTTQGTVIGAGHYEEHSSVTIGAIPNRYFEFSGWEDGNHENPRTITVDDYAHYVATFAPLSYSDTVDIHDTTIVDHYIYDTTIVVQINTIHDTTILNHYFHDTTIVDHFIHDTTLLLQIDTLHIFHQIHDTTIVNNFIHDTTILTLLDTLVVNNYIHDTTLLVQIDTFHVYHQIHDTTIVNNFIHDTTTLTLWDTLVVNNFVHDTTFINHYIHDTTNIFIYQHDTTIINHDIYHVIVDTLWLTTHDTLTLFLTDTIFLPQFLHDTLLLHDTLTVLPTSYQLQLISGNIDHGVTIGSGTFTEGTTVEFGALPVEGYRFVGWADGNNENPRQVVMDGNKTYVAIFEPQPQQSISDLEWDPVEVSTHGTFINVKGAIGETIRIFDVKGVQLTLTAKAAEYQSFSIPATGVYFVQVGNRKAQKVVIVK